jgi:hypothetical protein
VAKEAAVAAALAEGAGAAAAAATANASRSPAAKKVKVEVTSDGAGSSTTVGVTTKIAEPAAAAASPVPKTKEEEEKEHAAALVATGEAKKRLEEIKGNALDIVAKKEAVGKEYLVKWKHCSYWHVTWVGERRMQVLYCVPYCTKLSYTHTLTHSLLRLFTIPATSPGKVP